MRGDALAHAPPISIINARRSARECARCSTAGGYDDDTRNFFRVLWDMSVCFDDARWVMFVFGKE